MSLSPRDGRTDLKVRRRHDIVDAAARLMDERGAPQFSVDELARSAGVSRRTIFNHFASLDDVVGQVCVDLLSGAGAELAGAVAGREPRAGDTPAGVLLDALHTVDLITPIAALQQLLGPVTIDDHGSPTPHQLSLVRAFSEVGLGLEIALRRRFPDDDPDRVAVLIGAVMGGVVAMHQRWITRTGGRDDPASRTLWIGLLDHLLLTLLPATTSPRPAQSEGH